MTSPRVLVGAGKQLGIVPMKMASRTDFTFEPATRVPTREQGGRLLAVVTAGNFNSSAEHGRSRRVRQEKKIAIFMNRT